MKKVFLVKVMQKLNSFDIIFLNVHVLSYNSKKKIVSFNGETSIIFGKNYETTFLKSTGWPTECLVKLINIRKQEENFIVFLHIMHNERL